MNETMVRCRYCVLGDVFRPMVVHPDGIICAKCGHLANPSEANFECSCPKCLDLGALNCRRG